MKLNIKSLSYSTIITIAFITLLTVWSEMSKPLKDTLAGVTGHHWITKGLLSLMVFIVLYFILSGIYKKPGDARKQSSYVVVATILGGLIIFLFYVWHFLS